MASARYGGVGVGGVGRGVDARERIRGTAFGARRRWGGEGIGAGPGGISVVSDPPPPPPPPTPLPLPEEEEEASCICSLSTKNRTSLHHAILSAGSCVGCWMVGKAAVRTWTEGSVAVRDGRPPLPLLLLLPFGGEGCLVGGTDWGWEGC
jgi:hypothetical protein